MDETVCSHFILLYFGSDRQLTPLQVVNGAQSFYKKAFGIGSDSEKDAWLLGLVNSAPYLCCALVGIT